MIATEPVEEVAVLGGAALEGDVSEGQAAGALVWDEGADLEVLDVRHLDREHAALLEASVRDVVDLDDELELLVAIHSQQKSNFNFKTTIINLKNKFFFV